MTRVSTLFWSADPSASRSVVRRFGLALPCAALLLASACATEPPPVAGDSVTAKAGAPTDRATDVSVTPAQASRIRVAAVAIAPYRPSVATTGTVAFNADRSTQVLAPVSGPITAVMVSPGAVVQKGAALATVTSPDFATALADYRKSLSAYRNAQRISDLDEQLFKNDAISRREMEQAQTDAAAAVADRDAAIEQMRALGVDEAGIAAARENRTPSQLQAVIRAPISGTVVEKLCTQGQLIQAGSTACFTIADLSTVWVMANVFETDLSSISNGEEATITAGALPSPVTGHVTYIGSLVDPTSKATAVRIVTPNPRELLKRDMLVDVSIRASQGRNGILIPTSAVLRDDQNLPFLYLALPNNHFSRRPITIGMRVGDQYEVKGGLTAGDKIVVDGALFLQFAGNQ
jgi:cobalt-zinc-cadmium efflux system membrane fusion protein